MSSLTRFTVVTDNGPDGTLRDRYAIFDNSGDWPACKTIGTGEGDLSLTCLTRADAERKAAELNTRGVRG